MQFTPPFPKLHDLKQEYIRSNITYQRGRQLLDMEMCTITSQDKDSYQFAVEDRFEDYNVSVDLKDHTLSHTCNCASLLRCCHHAAAALLLLDEKFQEESEKTVSEQGEPYTREEMIKRVLREREERADQETFRMVPADNIFGIHQIITSAHRRYEITIRDFVHKNGYCSCPDYQTNKLATCKHLIFALRDLRRQFPVGKLTDTQPYPFVEIYCDPLNDYHITYFYKGNLNLQVASLLEKYFQGDRYILPERYPQFLNFLREAGEIKKILVRPEVTHRIDKHFEQQQFARLAESITPDFGKIKTTLFDYQKEGVRFSLFKPGTIIADEMGLGKTIQAITVALLKRDIFGFRRTLVICPASLKEQWKKEIARFTGEQAVVIDGPRDERTRLYRESEHYFLIANYEAVMRDVTALMQHPPDMIILDEAQRIKNYETKTSYAVKAIPKKHCLVITGTPLENRLIDLYSIMNFIDPEILAPLWEFSMNHCYFDKSKKNKITGYYNLQQLKERLAPWVIRREKKEVLDQLPDVQEMNVPITLHPAQQEMHAGMARSLAPIITKKHKTIYDMQRIQQILTSMRMVCDSTFLIDKESNYSPKLEELEEILLEKLDIQQPGKKVIIFSEWKTMLRLIEKMLKANGIRSVMLTGEVAVKKRGKLIETFEQDPACKVFLSSEAGGSGLNLQMADTVINFELPWNPAKKNQRIGRVHRIGQQSSKITAINLVARQSIEERILEGIVLKESLFDAVLSEGDMTDEVDFSSRGRSVFIEQVEKLIQPFEYADAEEASPAFEPEISDEGIDRSTLFKETAESGTPREAAGPPPASPAPEPQPAAAGEIQPEALEATLNQGLQFLSGLMQMATGKTLATEGQSISIDKETGEVVMKFKLPKM